MATKRKGTTVKTTAKPAKQATLTKKESAAKEAFEEMYDTKAPSVADAAASPASEEPQGKLVSFRVNDCRDCPHLQDYGAIALSNKQRRRYGCLPLVLRKRAGENVEYPFIEVSSEHVTDTQSWRPHPQCPLGLT